MIEAINGLLDAGYEFHMLWSPPVHEIAMHMYDVMLFPVLFFSSLFYIMAFSGLFTNSSPIKRFDIKKWPRVTVQIPTLNEIVAIRCAKKCLNFDYPRGRYEIIIGDDSDSPDISREIDSFAKKHPGMVRVTRRKNREGFKAGNLNNMLRHTRGDIIVTFDSDFMPERDFLKRVIPSFVNDEKVEFVQTKWKYINISQNTVSRFASSILMVYQNILASLNSRLGVPLLFGSAQAVRKDFLIKTGGWKEGSLTEDVEFSIRALSTGKKSLYITDTSVPGEVPFTFRGFFKQQKRWAYGNAKTFLSYKRWILFGKDINILQRASLTFTLLGYIASPFLVLFMFFGTLSFMTGDPAVINIPKFLSSTGFSIAVNSGFMAALVVALAKEKKMRMILHVLLGAFTVGLYTAFGVTSGFIKAFTGRNVPWYMIRKAGNESGRHFRSSAVS